MGELAKWGGEKPLYLIWETCSKKKKKKTELWRQKKLWPHFPPACTAAVQICDSRLTITLPCAFLKKVKQLLQSGWDGLSLIRYQQSGFAAASCSVVYCKSQEETCTSVFNLCVCVCAQSGVTVLIRRSSLSASSEGLVCGLKTGLGLRLDGCFGLVGC